MFIFLLKGQKKNEPKRKNLLTFRYRCTEQAFAALHKNRQYNGSKCLEFGSCLRFQQELKFELLILQFATHAETLIHVRDFHGSFSY